MKAQKPKEKPPALGTPGAVPLGEPTQEPTKSSLLHVECFEFVKIGVRANTYERPLSALGDVSLNDPGFYGPAILAGVDN